MNFTVSLTSSAKQDIRSAIRWIEERSRPGAERWYRRWLGVLDTLSVSAESCGLAPEDESHEETIHQVIFKTRHGLPYRALFIIREQRVHVLHVRGPGQNLMTPDEVRLPE